MLSSIATFYAPGRVQLRFGATGNYTIVKNRHIGIDQGTNRQAIDVPALLPGRVVDVVRAHRILGSVVVVDVGVLAPWGRRVYLSYCHMSKDRLPEIGAWLAAGDRVGRLAAGPKSLPSWEVDYPGSSWGGIHLHLVAGFHPRSAHQEVSGHRTLEMFIDPADLVWRALNGAPAGGNARPLEDEMSAEAERMIAELYQELLPGKAGVKSQGAVHKVFADILAAVRGASSPSAADTARAVWATTVKRGGKDVSALQELADAKTYAAEGAKGVTSEQVQVIADAIAKQVGSALKVDAAAIARAVNDDAAARMKS